MDQPKAHEQEQFECFGIPPHVQVEGATWAAPVPPGWGRREWLLRGASFLGAEASPSPDVEPFVEIDVVR